MNLKIKSLLFLLVLSFAEITAQCGVSLKNFPDDKVMVVAHRGDWRNAPENSVWAIKKAIEMGVDMAEIDLAITKDSILILMHDKTIDRTTTGKGKPEDFTFAELQQLYLKDGIGVKTEMKIPTLEEILKISKGKILLNLDKGFNYIGIVYPMLKKYDMLDEVLFKGAVDYKIFNQNYGHLKNDIHFMPIVRLSEGEGWEKINEYNKNYKAYGYEFTVGTTEKHLIDFNEVRKSGAKVWVNSLWVHHNAGNNDDKVLENPRVYEWFILKGINIIQTDRPKELIDFLKFYGLKYQN
ncbi:MAG: glycerophosphodiester phosphodiesterase family protein [Cruoricaptor ignavus]|nr:glycerophosphodiester phosphodiesterase family protein [Cruoricaptor ignavus]